MAKRTIREPIGPIKLGQEDVEQKEFFRVKIQNAVSEMEELFPEKSIISNFSEEEMIKMKVYEVTNDSQEPKVFGSVNDPRGGPSTTKEICVTCGCIDCPGHYGFIKFPEKIYNPLTMPYVVYCLMSVCNSCGELLLNEHVIESRGFKKMKDFARLKAIAKASKGTQCMKDVSKRSGEEDIYSCTINPDYVETGLGQHNQIKYKVADEKDKYAVKDIKSVYMILNSISVKSAAILGFTPPAHPRNFIMGGILVVPPIARPPRFVDGVLAPDPLTKDYIQIFRDTQPRGTGTRQQSVMDIGNRIFESVKTLILGSDKKTLRGGHKSLGIKNSLQGKEALFRGTAMGKRGNFCGRTVAGPDPSLRYGEIGIPEDMARILTIEETVQDFNKEYLVRLMAEGKITHITFSSGDWKGLQKAVVEGNSYVIQRGDKVERWLQNGDVIIGNRQPSLHAPSMMGYYVRIGKHKTIRMHMSATTPLNMDFDGDEGNAFLPRTPEARAEAREIMHITKNVMSTERNQPTMALVYDSIVSAYLLTDERTVIPSDIFAECLDLMPGRFQLKSLNQRLERYAVPPFSGRALFSALLPFDFTYTKQPVVIVDGVLIKGQITKGNIGVVHRSIVQDLHKMYGSERACEFINDASFLFNKYLTYRGFTVGVADTMPGNTDLITFNAEEFVKTKLAVERIGVMSKDPLERERQERDIIEILDTTKSRGGDLVKKVMRENRNAFRIMTNRGSGAKGDDFNVGQIMSAVQQPFYGGERIKQTMTEGERCLPHFDRNSLDILARGFVKHSFMQGLNPEEYFATQLCGREGSTDTSTKTSETGHLSHEIVKAMEDLRVAPDGSTRNSAGIVFQAIYGGDGFNAAELLSVNLSGKTNYATFTDVKAMATFFNSKAGWVKRENLPVEVPPIPVRPPIEPPAPKPDILEGLTKYEKSQIIGLRVKALYEGETPLVDTTGITDPFEIVKKELEEGFAPYIIERYPPGPPGSGKIQIVKIMD